MSYRYLENNEDKGEQDNKLEESILEGRMLGFRPWIPILLHRGLLLHLLRQQSRQHLAKWRIQAYLGSFSYNNGQNSSGNIWQI